MHSVVVILDWRVKTLTEVHFAWSATAL